MKFVFLFANCCSTYLLFVQGVVFIHIFSFQRCSFPKKLVSGFYCAKKRSVP